MAESREGLPQESQDSDNLNITWRNSLFGIGTALCFSLSAIPIRSGLQGLPSPLLGVTVGMSIAATVYGLLVLLRHRHIQRGPVPRSAWLFLLAAGAIGGLSTWARWIALDMAPVAVVMTLGRMNVPMVIFLAPLLVGRKNEKVTARVWLGAALIVAGAVLLNFFS
jgi:uncharacterized membrane protein